MLAGGSRPRGTPSTSSFSGDGVELFDLPKEIQEKGAEGVFGKKDRSRVNVKIDGDQMTITGDDGKAMNLTRVK